MKWFSYFFIGCAISFLAFEFQHETHIDINETHHQEAKIDVEYNESISLNPTPLNFTKTNVETKKVLSLLEDNLHLINDEPFVFLEPIVKKINDKTFQTVHYAPAKNGETGWTFTTWEVDQESNVSLVDNTTYNNDTTKYGSEIAQYWYELWKENDHHYVPYKNLSLHENLLEQAKSGKLIGVEFPIGTSINRIKTGRSRPMEEGYYEGTKYLFYPEDTYFYDERTGEVIGLGLNGNRLKLTLDQVKDQLGSPTEEGFNALEGEAFILYSIGDYNLYFYENNINKLVSNVILRKTKENQD